MSLARRRGYMSARGWAASLGRQPGATLSAGRAARAGAQTAALFDESTLQAPVKAAADRSFGSPASEAVLSAPPAVGQRQRDAERGRSAVQRRSPHGLQATVDHGALGTRSRALGRRASPAGFSHGALNGDGVINLRAASPQGNIRYPGIARLANGRVIPVEGRQEKLFLLGLGGLDQSFFQSPAAGP